MGQKHPMSWGNERAEGARGVEIRVFSQVIGVENGVQREGKARWEGVSRDQEVAARCAPSWKLGVQRAWAGAGRLTEWGVGWTRAVMGLQDWAE